MAIKYFSFGKKAGGLFFVVLFFILGSSLWAQPRRGLKMAEPPEDNRQMVEMPLAVQQVLRQDMVSHLAAIDSVIASLAEGDLNRAAETAESQLGRSSMGRHAGTGLGPGRFMPPAMHDIAFSMHQAASAFAGIVKKGDITKSYAALKEVTGHCITCHSAFRIR